MITMLQSQELVRLVVKSSKANSATSRAIALNDWSKANELLAVKFEASDELVKYIESLVEPQ